MLRPSSLIKRVLLVVLTLLLFVAGTAEVLYSAWFQDGIRQGIVRMLNKQPGTSFGLDELSLRLPLDIDLRGIWMIQDGDTVLAAREIAADVVPAPLLIGRIDLSKALLVNAVYRMGNRDSATMMVLRADTADIAPARVKLSPMSITVEDGELAGAVIDLYINPNPPKASLPSAATEPSEMKVEINRLLLRNLQYRMNMLPTIDSLGVSIGNAELRGAGIDLKRQTIDIDSLVGRALSAAYIAPDSATIANTVVAPPDTTVSLPWTVRVQRMAFDQSQALYTTRGVEPQPGLDFAYIAAGDVQLAVDDFFNCGTIVRVPLNLAATERCGIRLDLAGTLDIDSLGIGFRNFALNTTNSTCLKADGYMGTGDLTADPSLPLRLNASGDLAIADAMLAMPALSTYLQPAANNTLSLNTNISGTSGALDIKRLSLDVPGVMSLGASGQLENAFNPDRLTGDLLLRGGVDNIAPWKRTLLAGTGIDIPRLTLDGDIHFEDGAYEGTLTARTGHGSLAFDGGFSGRGPTYDADIRTSAFPVQAFMPDLGVGEVTAHLTVDGQGIDPMNAATSIHATADIADIAYNKVHYRNIILDASLAGGEISADVKSDNPGMALDLAANGKIEKGRYIIDGNLHITDLALKQLGVSETPADLAMDAVVSADFNPTLTDVAAKLTLTDLSYRTTAERIYVDNVTLRVNATDSLTNASVRNRDLYAFFSAPCGLDSLSKGFTDVIPVIDNLMAQHRISATALQEALPPFNLDISAGSNNALTQILKGSDMGLKSLAIRAYNDSLFGLHGTVTGFNTGTTRVDSIFMDISQSGPRLMYAARVANRPGTMDDWAHVLVDGFIDDNRLELGLSQHNIRGVTGFDLDADVEMRGDSLAVLKFNNLEPTIGYRKWTINKGNFLAWNFPHRHLDADLHIEGNDSHLAIFTEHATSRDSADHSENENLVIDISNIRIQDWISINPFAPSVTGNLSANVTLNAHENHLSGRGGVTLDNLVYGKERVGNFHADLNALTAPDGLIRADVALFVNGRKSLTLDGALNDSTKTSPLNLDLALISFPLETANAFLPGIAKLQGTLNGSMAVSGDTGHPILDGWVQFDSTAVAVTMLGSTFRFSDERIPVEENVVTIDAFNITGANSNPLTVDGTVDISNLSNAAINIGLHAANMQLVNTNKAARGAEVFGKAFVNLDASARGNLSFLTVKANASILPGTNVTYVMTDAQTALASQSQNSMVRFVNFADTAAMAAADSIQPPQGTILNLLATLNINDGASINVFLDPGGTDRLVLQPQGSLTYQSNPLVQDKMTGRLNINSGWVRYNIPVIGEKRFEFNEGSYVAFTGNMLNPSLNVRAVDHMRANVTQTGSNSRLIYFDVLLDVTGSLENMNVKFDLATDDDASVANELASMSPSQRASTAMNMLLTGMYAAGDTKADANLSGNALYSFLTSQLNSWAANTIKGVDLSFGVSQYDNVRNGSSTQATQYSYQVSKSLFNDRFRIVVGGNYTTDADPGESVADDLLSDVSFEYLLNQQGTMLIRIFRHTGYESILEGQITQTGVGFVYKRRVNNLWHMFRPFHRKRNADAVPKSDTIENTSDSTANAHKI